MLAALTFDLLRSDPGAGSIPELSCCGGWDNALVLRGLPTKFFWWQPLRLGALTLGILGAAGLALAALEVDAANRGFLAVLITAAIYWGGTLPLWLFNDRYYLVMLPAGCLLLAAAPPPAGVVSRAAGLVLLAGLGWFAAAGVYDQQRGLEAVIAARDALTREGVPRAAIDAGYPLNGEDLYRSAPPGQKETFETEAGIPMITSGELEEYTIASAPVPGTAIGYRFGWPGMSGLGRRELYVLKSNAVGPASSGSPLLSVKPGQPPQNDLPSPSTLMLILARLAAIALMMLAPLIAVLAAFTRSLKFDRTGS